MSNKPPTTFTSIYGAGAIVLVPSYLRRGRLRFRNIMTAFFLEEITGTASELQDTGTRITSLGDAGMKDMDDYTRAYSEMAPLLDDYD